MIVPVSGTTLRERFSFEIRRLPTAEHISLQRMELVTSGGSNETSASLHLLWISHTDDGAAGDLSHFNSSGGFTRAQAFI